MKYCFDFFFRLDRINVFICFNVLKNQTINSVQIIIQQFILSKWKFAFYWQLQQFSNYPLKFSNWADSRICFFLPQKYECIMSKGWGLMSSKQNKRIFPRIPLCIRYIHTKWCLKNDAYWLWRIHID